jgi:hypothetical protein
MGNGAGFLFLFQNVRSPKQPACCVVAVYGRATLSASGCLPEATGGAWLRPCFFEQPAKGS